MKACLDKEGMGLFKTAHGDPWRLVVVLCDGLRLGRVVDKASAPLGFFGAHVSFKELFPICVCVFKRDERVHCCQRK